MSNDSRTNQEQELATLRQQLAETIRNGERSRLALLSILEDEKDAKKGLAKKTLRLESLYQAVTTIGATLDIPEICRAMDRAIGNCMRHAGIYITMLDPLETGLLSLYMRVGDEEKDVAEIPLIPLAKEGKGIQSTAIRTGQPELITDYPARVGQQATIQYHYEGGKKLAPGLPKNEGLSKSALVVPIMLAGNAIGVIQVFDDQTNRFTSDDLAFVTSLAPQLAAALSNARLYQQASEEVRQRAAAEQKLRASEEQYRTLVEGMNEGLIQVDNDDVIQFVNDRFCELCGYPRESLVGQVGYRLLFDQTNQEVIRQKNRDRQAGKSEKYEVRLRRQDGQERWVSVSGAPVTGPDGAVTGSIGAFTDITERKLAEEAAKASEERYQTFVNSTSDLAFLKDDQMRYVMVNEANRRIFGLPDDQIIGRSDFDLMPQESALACRRTDLLAIEHNRVMINEEIVEGKIYETRKFPVRLEGGKTGVGGFIRDITEHRKADLALRASEERFRSVFENTFIGIYRTTPDGKIVLANPALVKMLGYVSREELEQRNLEAGGYAAGYDRGEFKRLMETAGEMIGHEACWQRSDGSTIWVRESARAIRGTDGSILYYEGTVEDITGRKLAELALQESERKYRVMVESINDVIFSVDTDGTLTYISPAIERIVKYTVAEIVGQPFARFIHPDDLAALQASFARNLEGIDEPAPFRIIDKDGMVKHVRSVSHLVSENGAAAGITGTMTDYTHQHRIELEKAQVEDDLRQAQKMEAIGQLAGGVAHDFNNMLTGIMGNGEMLMIKLANEPALLELSERIVHTAETAAKLTRQLLSFARKGKYEMGPVDVHKLVADAAGILGNTIDRRIRIRQSLSADLHTVTGDASQLENALINLGLNARDAMPQGGELIFSTQVVELDGDYMRLHGYKMVPGDYVQATVTDTGTGMPPEVRAHLFEPFFTTKEPGKGTGLGMASVYGIVKGHNGAIEVYSEQGHGTAIKIFLPLIGSPEAGPAAGRAEPIAAGHGTILLVDDEPMIRDIASQMLQNLGYQVATCVDGQEAIEYFTAHHGAIDLVILDMIMPKLNGRETYQLMRTIDPDTRVILSSGFSAEGEAQELMKLGIKGFVQKPYRLKELAAKIAEALGR